MQLDELWSNPRGVDMERPFLYLIRVVDFEGHDYRYVGKGRSRDRLVEYRRNMQKISEGKPRGETQRYRAVHLALYHALVRGWAFSIYPYESIDPEASEGREKALIEELGCNLNRASTWSIEQLDALEVASLIKGAPDL